MEYSGNKTECALLEMLYRMGVDYRHLRSPERVIKTFPFTAVHKMMGTVFRDDSGSELVFVKGAPELLLPYCTNYLNRNNCLAKVTAEMYDTIVDVV
jgi:magnesium-transporting ATPase (P-type)